MGFIMGPVTSNPFKANKLIANAAASYTAGKAIGALLELDVPSPVTPGLAGPQALVNSVCVIDLANQKPALDIVLLEATSTTDKTAPTDPGDGNTFDPAIGDAVRIAGVIEVAASTWKTYGSRAVASIGGLAKSIPYSGRTIWAVIVAQGSVTYSATNQLRLKLTGITT